MNNLSSNDCVICGRAVNHDQIHCTECEMEIAIERIQNILEVEYERI